MKLTVKSTEGLKLPRGKTDHIEFDDVIAGWGLRLREGGSRAWVFQYAIGNHQNQKTRRITFGKYPAMDVPTAREQAAKFHAQVGVGGDPAMEKAAGRVKAGETFEACMQLYLERRRHDGKLRASTLGEIERHLARNLKALHGLPIHNVDRRAIALELARLTEIGPVQANRTRASLVRFLNWCAGEGFIDANPAMFTNKNPERARDRVLTGNELQAIWRALPDGDFGDVIRLLMLTGQRAREISELSWDEIDLERGIITLPPARTKTRRGHTIPIAPAAAEILKARTRSPDRSLVFGLGQGGFSGWSGAKEQLDAKVKIPAWVIHDLRRTVATGMGEIGILPHVVEGVLGHVSGAKAGVAGIYNRAGYEAEKAVALGRWAEHLMSIVKGRPSKIASLRRA